VRYKEGTGKRMRRNGCEDEAKVHNWPKACRCLNI